MDNLKKSILVVEDEKDMRRVLQFRLEGLGYQVIIAKDGEEGLDLVRNAHIDLIVLDLMLPKISGEEVCRQLKKDKLTEKIPILMLTAKSQDADKVIGKVIGADYYLTKPFDGEVLIEQVKKLINGAGGGS